MSVRGEAGDAADETAALSGELCTGGGTGDCAERMEDAGGVS